MMVIDQLRWCLHAAIKWHQTDNQVGREKLVKPKHLQITDIWRSRPDWVQHKHKNSLREHLEQFCQYVYDVFRPRRRVSPPIPWPHPTAPCGMLSPASCPWTRAHAESKTRVQVTRHEWLNIYEARQQVILHQWLNIDEARQSKSLPRKVTARC